MNPIEILRARLKARARRITNPVEHAINKTPVEKRG